MGVAPILAPLIGGYVLLWFGWQMIFWVLAALGVAVSIAAGALLPETRTSHAAFGLGHVLRNYAAVLRDRHFLGYTLGGALPMAGMFAYIAGSPYVFIELFGVEPEAYGWLFGSNAIGFIGAAQVNRRLLRHYSPDAILRVGALASAAAGVVLVIAAATGIGGLLGMVVPLFFTVAPLGIVMPNTTAGAMAGHGERAGTAAATMGILQFAAGGIASAAASALQDGTARPMAVAVASCMILGVVLRRALVRPAPATGQ
jgi:DHA1 family bicyclomycin/chloramphenicol resistance-like MFS transporter